MTGARLALRDFAVEVYGREGVRQACLVLQDDHGLDVNVLLFAAWAGAARARRLRPDDVRKASASVASWREDVVAPLRAVRRSLKASEPKLSGQEALRSKVKGAELEAELIQLDALEALADGLGEAARLDHDVVLANLRAVVAAGATASCESAEAAVAKIAAACSRASASTGPDA